MFKPKIKITGYEEIDKVLRGIEPKLLKKFLRRNMRKHLKPMAEKARSYAPVGPSWTNDKTGVHHTGGALRKAIKVRSAKSSKGPRLAVMIGEGDFKGETFYGAIQEYGGGGKGKGPRGPIKPKHFMKKAFDETHAQVQANTIEDIRSGLDELVKP